MSGLEPGTSTLPWLGWAVLAWLDSGLPGLGSLCGGEEATKADGLGGEAGGGEQVARLRDWDGPGWGGNTERHMSHTQHEADGGSGWARWSPCRSRTHSQSLSIRGRSLRRCERRRRPGPPRQSASRQRASLWAGLRATH